MRVYYELTLWEEVDDYDTEKLKGKMSEMAKRFAGFGCLTFNMRGQPPTVAQQAQAPPPPQQPPNPKQQAQPTPDEEEVIEE